jgi:transposase
VKPTHLNAAGIDGGATPHGVAVPADRDAQPGRPFGAFTADLYALAAWLRPCGIDTVAMASTGVYWIPLCEVLEERGFEVRLVDPHLVKQIPGRTTDVHDGPWRQERHSDGLLRGAFRPEEQVCTRRRDLRQRSLLMTSAARAVQPRQKALEPMNLQRTEVVNNIMGRTGRGIIRAILAGERDPQRLALRRERRCTPDTATIAKALQGHGREEHLFALQQAVDLGEFSQQHMKACDARIDTCLQEFERQGEASATPLAPSPRARQRHGHAPTFEVRASLDAITGVDLTRLDGIEALTALKLISEIGLEMTRWPTVTHVASWLGRCPGTNISGGTRDRSRRKPTANRAAAALRLAAHSLDHSHSALGADDRRRKARLGAPAALTATAHKLARLIYRLLRDGCEYVEAGQEAYEQRDRARSIDHLKRPARVLGYTLVQIEE